MSLDFDGTPKNVSVERVRNLLGIPEETPEWIILEGRFLDIDGSDEIPNHAQVIFDAEKPDLEGSYVPEGEKAKPVANIAPPESLIKKDVQDRKPLAPWVEAMIVDQPTCKCHRYEMVEKPNMDFSLTLIARECIACGLREVLLHSGNGRVWMSARKFASFVGSIGDGKPLGDAKKYVS
jgi:hypothetical protein